MKTIILKSLEIANFKGVKSFKAEFNQNKETNISGDNRTGKTTTSDAFHWLLNGKNSKDEKDFEIKNTVDRSLNRADHSVSAVFSVDGLEIKLQRVLREQWVKKRGSEEAELKGNETVFFYNEIPVSSTEFKAKVESIIGEQLLKLITSPSYFNSLNWTNQRQILSQMAGEINDQTIAGDSAELVEFLKHLNNEPIIEFKKRIAAQKKKIKDELDLIPARIDEVKRGMIDEPNFDELQKQLDSKKLEYSETESKIDDSNSMMKSESDRINGLIAEKHALKTRLTELQNAQFSEKQTSLNVVVAEFQKVNSRKSFLSANVSENNRKIELNLQNIESLKKINDGLREKVNQINGENLVFSDSDCVCPSCKRELENADQKRQTMLENFNANKLKRVEEINTRGISNKESIENMEKTNSLIRAENNSHQLELEQIEKSIEGLEHQKTIIESSMSVVPNSEEIDILRKQIDEFIIPELRLPDINDFKIKKVELNNEIMNIQRQLDLKDHNQKINVRIDELKDSEKKSSIEIARLERLEFSAEKFQKKKITEIENRINGKFKNVRWKMFEIQLNGGERETCECTLDGIPFSTLNTEGKVNAGIDIINALCEHYQITAPIFIDDRSIVSEIFECKSQIINLINIPGQKFLSIN